MRCIILSDCTPTRGGHGAGLDHSKPLCGVTEEVCERAKAVAERLAGNPDSCSVQGKAPHDEASAVNMDVTCGELLDDRGRVLLKEGDACVVVRGRVGRLFSGWNVYLFPLVRYCCERFSSGEGGGEKKGYVCKVMGEIVMAGPCGKFGVPRYLCGDGRSAR